MRCSPRGSWWLLPLALGLGSTADALARTEARSPYTKTQTYSGALRFLRVDKGFEVTERDPDAAYLLFRYVTTGRKQPSSGSIEIIEASDQVKIVIQLAEVPSYHEQVLRDGLLHKLGQEYGEPPKREKPPPEKGKRDDKGSPEAPSN